MAEKEEKKDIKIEYSPEELEELERITKILPGGEAESEPVDEAWQPPVREEAETDIHEESPSIDLGMPDMEFGDFETAAMPEEEVGQEIPEEFSMEADEGFGLEESPLEDITDLVHELEPLPDEFPEMTSGEGEEEDFLALQAGLMNDLDQEEEPLVEEAEPEEMIPEEQAFEPEEELSTLEQLEDISGEQEETFMEEPAFEGGDLALEGESDLGVPDLSDISLEASQEIPETEEVEVPDLDLGSMPDLDMHPAEEEPALSSDLLDESMLAGTAEEMPPSLEDMEMFDEAEPSVAEPSLGESFMAEGSSEDFGLEPVLDQIEDVVSSEKIPEIEPEFEPEAGPAKDEETLDLSSSELKKMKKAMLMLSAGLMQEVKNTILHDLLPPKETRQLVDMLLDGRPEDNIQHFLERKLNKKIDVAGTETPHKRRVIVARDAYTKEGLDRQKRLLRLTRMFGIAFLITLLVTVVSYHFIYIPWKAQSKIAEGEQYIRKAAEDKSADFTAAESIFKDVDQNYLSGFLEHYYDSYRIDAYTTYARAYFAQKRYDRALAKLNTAYDLKPANLQTLLTLGYFYSRLPGREYRRIKDKVHDYYFKRVPALGPVDTQLDVAVDFYRKVLNLDSNNQKALFGIGNAYYFQGEYIKARQYYENLLKVDSDSIEGHSGLLNLYVERDDFPSAVTTYVRLRNKGLLSDVPPALLGKLAAYLLGKTKTDTVNIRIDYGIESPRLKDITDNPYPAINEVLRSIKEKHPDYPPLYLYYAKLAQKQGNIKLMGRFLHNAVSLAEENNEKYFGALHMLGEYYYSIKEPVQAYNYLNQALQAQLNPPSFSYEDFYQESEHPGKTQALIGNIFYYFFDRVKAPVVREGALQEEMLEDENDQLANYYAAQKRYEAALKAGYSSSELYYNLGRIYYMKGLPEKALDNWLNLYDDFTVAPEIMFALGNAFYKLHNYSSAEAQYLKLISLYEYKSERIREISSVKKEHMELFTTLAAVYNNLGAIYQQQNNEVKSNLSYWRSIDYAKRINRESELARVNLARAFKRRKQPIAPILDENIPYSIDAYRAEMR